MTLAKRERPWVWIKGLLGIHPEPEPEVDDGRELVAAELDRIAALIRRDGTTAKMHARYGHDDVRRWGGWHAGPGSVESTLDANASDGTRVCITLWSLRP